jgi:hypothetical protein
MESERAQFDSPTTTSHWSRHLPLLCRHMKYGRGPNGPGQLWTPEVHYLIKFRSTDGRFTSVIDKQPDINSPPIRQQLVLIWQSI